MVLQCQLLLWTHHPSQNGHPMQEKDFVVIYPGNVDEVDLFTCLLDGEGILVFLQDEFIGRIAPYTASAGGVGAVKVLVKKSNVRKAHLIVVEVINTAA